MTDFPSLSYTSTSEFPTLLYTWRLIRVPRSGGASPIGHYREYPLPPGAYLAVKFPREKLEKTPLKLWQAATDQRVFIAKQLYDARVILTLTPPPPPSPREVTYLPAKFRREELEKTPLKLWQAPPDQRVFIAKQLYDARVIPHPHSPGETYLPAKFPREELEKKPLEVVAGTAGSACVDR